MVRPCTAGRGLDIVLLALLLSPWPSPSKAFEALRTAEGDFNEAAAVSATGDFVEPASWLNDNISGWGGVGGDHAAIIGPDGGPAHARHRPRDYGDSGDFGDFGDFERRRRQEITRLPTPQVTRLPTLAPTDDGTFDDDYYGGDVGGGDGITCANVDSRGAPYTQRLAVFDQNALEQLFLFAVGDNPGTLNASCPNVGARGCSSRCVGCDMVGDMLHITHLCLNSSNLEGTLVNVDHQGDSYGDSALCDMRYLRELDVSNNSLHGPIPDCIGTSNPNLSHLLAGLNGFTGPIPDELCQLDNLTHLALHQNALNGTIPSCMGTRLKKLQVLSLANNSLTGQIEPQFSGLSRLAFLALWNNHLNGTIDAICGLSSLTKLELGNNSLSGVVPHCIRNLSQVEVVHLGINDLHGPLDPLCQLPAVVELWLGNNRFQGAIPSCLTGLSQLRIIVLNNNAFSHSANESFINTEVCKMSQLRRLELDYNNLEEGPINECLCELIHLTQLRFAHTNRNGSIPRCIGKLTQMQNLSFGYNDLVGELPESLCNLTKLEALYVENNGIAGRFPNCFGSLTQLQQLDMMNLKLTGSIPAAMFTLPLLKYLLMSNAELQSSFPADIPLNHDSDRQQFMPAIEFLVMPSCGMTGDIPQWLGTLSKLESLDLSGNSLGGKLPTFLPNTPIKTIGLAYNNLEGTLDALSTATLLTRLNLDFNYINGVFPPWLAEQSSGMEMLKMRVNRLSGALPDDPAVTISPGGNIDFLYGNIYGCPIPQKTDRVDRHAFEYACGSSEFQYFATLLASMLFVVLLCFLIKQWIKDFVIQIYKRSGKFYDSVESWIFPVPPHRRINGLPGVADNDNVDSGVRDDDDDEDKEGAPPTPLCGWPTSWPKPIDAVDHMLIRTVWIIAAAWIIGLMPTYAAGSSHLSERYWWTYTAVGLTPGGWVYPLMVIGGLGGGMIMLLSVIIPGMRKGLVQLPHQLDSSQQSPKRDDDDDDNDDSAGEKCGRLAAAILMALAMFALSVSINVGFVRMEESLNLSITWKRVLVGLTAFMHEFVDHIMGPHVIGFIGTLLLLPSRQKRIHKNKALTKGFIATMYRVVVMFKLLNSLASPTLAFLVASDECLSPYMPWITDQPYTITFPRPYCGGNYLSSTTGGKEYCSINGLVDVSVTFLPDYTFNSQRCIASLISIYTPFYLMVFFLRIIWLPVSWFLVKRRTKWMLQGDEAPALLRSASFMVKKASSLGRSDTLRGSSAKDSRNGASFGRKPVAEKGSLRALATARNKPASRRTPHDWAVLAVRDVAEVTDEEEKSAEQKMLELVRSIERDVFVITSFAISLGPGMFSPFVALASAGCVISRTVMFWILQQRFGQWLDEKYKQQTMRRYPVPVEVIAMVLVTHSVFFILYLWAMSEGADHPTYYWLAITFAIINWTGFFAACYLLRPNGPLAGLKMPLGNAGKRFAKQIKTRPPSVGPRPRHVGGTPLVSNSDTLVEPLLPADDDDGGGQQFEMTGITSEDIEWVPAEDDTLPELGPAASWDIETYDDFDRRSRLSTLDDEEEEGEEGR